MWRTSGLMASPASCWPAPADGDGRGRLCGAWRWWRRASRRRRCRGTITSSPAPGSCWAARATSGRAPDAIHGGQCGAGLSGPVGRGGWLLHGDGPAHGGEADAVRIPTMFAPKRRIRGWRASRRTGGIAASSPGPCRWGRCCAGGGPAAAGSRMLRGGHPVTVFRCLRKTS